MAGKLTVGFLGAGKMATALAQGFVRAKLVDANDVIASDVSEAALTTFKRTPGATTAKSNGEVVKAAQVLILAVKPDQVTAVASEIKEALTEKHLLISIAAGVSLSKLESAFGTGVRLARVMPNTPALVGHSASAFAVSKSAAKEDSELVQQARGYLASPG